MGLMDMLSPFATGFLEKRVEQQDAREKYIEDQNKLKDSTLAEISKNKQKLIDEKNIGIHFDEVQRRKEEELLIGMYENSMNPIVFKWLKDNKYFYSNAKWEGFSNAFKENAGGSDLWYKTKVVGSNKTWEQHMADQLQQPLTNDEKKDGAKEGIDLGPNSTQFMLEITDQPFSLLDARSINPVKFQEYRKSTLDIKNLASNKLAQAGLALITGGVAPAILALTGIPQKIANTIIGKVNSGEDLTEEEQVQADALANEVALSKREKYFESRPQATSLSRKIGGMTVTGRVGLEVGDIDPVTGGIFNKAGQAVDPRTNENLTSYRSFKDAKVSMKAGAKAGGFGGEISNRTYMGLGEEGKKRYGNYVRNMAEEGVDIESEGRGGTGTGGDGFRVLTKDKDGKSQLVTKTTSTGESQLVEDKGNKYNASFNPAGQAAIDQANQEAQDNDNDDGGSGSVGSGSSFEDIKKETEVKGFTGEYGVY